ncbi:histidine kinase-like ATPase [Phycomyces nitens]|nr:histidine kinase-like ATPase [Phycomyces nitens]
MSAQRIKRLDPTVVNRIAAGEIIQRPANALKELIENSLDAGSTRIDIFVSDGGCKLLRIKDNGHGILLKDMDIVCERFTTSKLTKFEDLSSIATHGFRGEALASISHVAHLSITTKTADSPCAFCASYSDGKLVPAKPGQKPDPKPCSGTDGTQITAEDLFYNVPTRKKTLKSPLAEYKMIIDVVSQYAVHNNNVSFTCKKQGSLNADVHTSANPNVANIIRQIYGSSIASELISVEKTFESLEFKMKAHISNPNYSTRKMHLLLFINNRLVESKAIAQMIKYIYESHLPVGTYPFVYLGLEINPRNVDVNIHPTKQTVHFLNEDRVIGEVQAVLEQTLSSVSLSREFMTKSGVANTPYITPEKDTSSSDLYSQPDKSTSSIPSYNKIRTDNKERTLDAFLYNEGNQAPGPQKPLGSSSVHPKTEKKAPKQRVEVRLKSIKDLLKELNDLKSRELTELLDQHTYIGCVDETLALIQHGTKIYLVNHNTISEALFYQVVLQGFCNFGSLRLDSPIDISKYLEMAIQAEELFGCIPTDIPDKKDIINSIREILVSRAELLKEYFNIEVSQDGMLHSLPLLLQDYEPVMDKLPSFLLRLGTEIDWTSEKKCFEGIARELAIFYSTEPLLVLEENDQEQLERYMWQIQNIIFPSLKSYFIAPLSLAVQEDCIRTLTSTDELYKIFERC